METLIMSRKVLLLLALVLNLVNHSLRAETLGPEDLIKDIFQKTGKENLLLNSKLKSEVESHIDFSEMSKAILAEEYAKQTSGDLKWFETTLKEIITRSVYPSAPKFLENVKITYKKTKSTESDARVSSSVSKKGESTDVDYVLKKINNEWKVVDVAIDEESWVKTINEKVQKTLKEKGWKGLKDLLTKRLNELKNNKKKS
jgi:ABC-type transporter MlaC component